MAGAQGAYARPDAVVAGQRGAPVIAFLFLISLAIPANVMIFVGPMRMSPYRILLVVMAVPTLFMLISGRGGRVRLFDWLMIFHAIWAAVALMAVHGPGRIWEFAGITVMEALIPYTVARTCIRTVDEFTRVVKLLFWLVLIMLPFTAYESITGHHILYDIFKFLGTASPYGAFTMEPRMGLIRALGPFEHPILYGVFCASAVALTYYVLGRRNGLIMRTVKTVPVMLATAFSLSAGALVAMAIQLGLAGWEYVTQRFRHRWMILASLFGLAWVAVSLTSTRSPILVFIDRLTFSVHNAYIRVAIWDYGTASVRNHPVFGIGLNEWARPSWLPTSIDNFWLVEPVRYGLPAFLFLASAALLILFKLGRAKLEDERHKACRHGLLMSLIGVSVAACTVHFWNSLFVYFMFLLGTGVWLFDAERGGASDEARRPASWSEEERTAATSRPWSA